MTHSADSLAQTRRAWHAVAELLVAGPQYASGSDIRLVVTPDGFTGASVFDVAVAGTDLVTPAGRFPIAGSIAAVAEAAGITPRSLTDVYQGGLQIELDDPIEADPDAAAVLSAAFRDGDDALRRLDAAAERVLWPEHFDVGISADEVNYGVSPGDSYIDVPYAYVGPWDMSAVAADPFWNQSFGAAVPVSELGGADEILEFFRRGRTILKGE